MLERRAPDLFYAGSKFNRCWLVRWLRNPLVIRRADVMFLNHTTTEGRKDLVRETSIKPCPVQFPSEQAEAVADHLMTLKDPAMKNCVVDTTKTLRKHKAFRP